VARSALVEPVRDTTRTRVHSAPGLTSFLDSADSCTSARYRAGVRPVVVRGS
jgi:hypothetical protein